MSGPGAAADASPTRRLLRAAPSVLLYLAAGVAAYFLWPTSLGGCTTLTVVSGESMEPTYRTGDVVVARCGEPEVGDVVVYQPEGYGGVRIIHRVIGGDASGWALQGDNNSWIDPFEPTNDEVLGVAKLHLPKVGLAARALMNPIIWLSLIAIALAILAWPSGRGESGIESGDGDSDDDGARLTEGGTAGPEDVSEAQAPAQLAGPSTEMTP